MQVPDYPGYGEKCNGCGQCCLDQPCPVSRNLLLWSDGRCTALVLDKGIYRCGMMTTPDKFSQYIPRRGRNQAAENVREMLGAGVRCDTRKR